MLIFLLSSCVVLEKLDDLITADTGTAPVAQTRGIWAWRDAGDPNGTDAVVGDVAAEIDMVDTLVSWGVVRVYGSYGNRPVSEPAVIGAWNKRLHEAGIESHVLLGDPSWYSSREWGNMEVKIQDRLLDFNDGRSDPDERFDGLHLDIEPQADAAWDLADEATKYAYLDLLRYAYDDAASTVAGSGLSIAADLPVWFDKLPPALGGTGSIGWPSAAERDDWFAGLALDSISMMAYERDDDAVIISDVSGEEGLFPGELRVGLNEEVGTTWADIDEMFAMAETLEAQGYAVDLHAYSDIRALLP